jgi:hypothetical protein
MKPAFAVALLDIQQQQAEQQLKGDLLKLQQEESRLIRILQETQAQLTAIQSAQKRLQSQSQEESYFPQLWEALEQSIKQDRGVLSERAIRYILANQEKRERILSEIRIPKTKLPQGGIPESLRPLLVALEVPARLKLPRASIGVIVSTEPETGPTKGLLVITPTSWSRYTQWASIGVVSDLALQLAWRTLGVIYQLLQELHTPAPVRCIELSGNLAISVWLEAAIDIQEPLLNALQRSYAEAAELEAAELEIYTFWVKASIVGLEAE